MPRRMVVVTAVLGLTLGCNPLQAQNGAAGSGGFHRAVAPSPAPGSIYLHPERIRLQDGSWVTAERGFIFVPVNRSNPASGVMSVEVYRFRARPGAPAGVPPVFRLPGGPSFQGLEGSLATAGHYEREIAPYLEFTDYVVVGQRGLGTSRPTTACEPPRPPGLDATPAQREAAHREASRRCRRYWEEQGLDLSGLTVLEAADDVDDVRRALGYDRIQLSGGSFGSHWSMAIMRRHPHIVVRALLHGLEGPDHTYDSPTGLLNSIRNIAAEADTATALRGMVPPGGLLNAFREVIARLDREPATVTVQEGGETYTVRVDGDAVRAVARGYAGGPAGWPANVLAMYHGDYTGPARALVRGATRPGIQPAAYFMLDCGSGITPERLAAMDADTAAQVVGIIEWSYRTVCPEWGADLGNEFRQNFPSEIPTLFVHGDRDLSTPLENALELAPYFANRHFVLVRGGSHGALGEAMRTFPGFREQVLRFFATGEMRGMPAELTMPPVRWVVPGTQSQE